MLAAKHLQLAGVSLFFLSLQISAAADKNEAELKQVQSKILQLKESQQDAKKSQQAEQKTLANIEKSLGIVVRRLRKLARDTDAANRTLSDLQAQKQKLSTGLAQQQTSLAVQLRAAYGIGEQEPIKLLLNQQNPAEISRTLTYYNYLNRARAEKIIQFRQTLVQISALNDLIEEKKMNLANLAAQAKEDRASFAEQSSDRKAALLALSGEIEARDQQMISLRKNEKDLQDLLQSLQATLADVPNKLNSQGPFTSNKGKLPWPVQGSFVARFGQKRASGDSAWRGTLIGATEGKEVRAIAHGRVAFADWLKGFGLLLILDHGDGYMSLYGYNQSLFKVTGDWVQDGEVISSVGNSGGQSSTGLYFEIRKQGQPVDPASWCRQVAAK